MTKFKFINHPKLTGIKKMEKNLYIDTIASIETRIVLKSSNTIEEYEFEDKNNLNFKNNIYLASMSRVNLLSKQHL